MPSYSFPIIQLGGRTEWAVAGGHPGVDSRDRSPPTPYYSQRMSAAPDDYSDNTLRLTCYIVWRLTMLAPPRYEYARAHDLAIYLSDPLQLSTLHHHTVRLRPPCHTHSAEAVRDRGQLISCVPRHEQQLGDFLENRSGTLILCPPS